jgi:hypothetical protein
VYFTVDTLKYLAGGGRINSARRLLGSVLNVKPILEIRDGKIELVSSVISRRKAIERILQLVEKGIDRRLPVRISVFHALARETAQELLETARLRFIRGQSGCWFTHWSRNACNSLPGRWLVRHTDHFRFIIFTQVRLINNGLDKLNQLIRSFFSFSPWVAF